MWESGWGHWWEKGRVLACVFGERVVFSTVFLNTVQFFFSWVVFGIFLPTAPIYTSRHWLSQYKYPTLLSIVNYFLAFSMRNLRFFLFFSDAKGPNYVCMQEVNSENDKFGNCHGRCHYRYTLNKLYLFHVWYVQCKEVHLVFAGRDTCCLSLQGHIPNDLLV